MNILCKLFGHVESKKYRPDKHLSEFLGGRYYIAYCIRCGKKVNFPNVNHPGCVVL